MFSEYDLRELVNYHANQPMLSLYLNTDPTSGNADSYRLRLRNMLKSIDLDEDKERVERFFDTEYDWSGKSVAVFSNAEEDFFRVFPLAVTVPDLVHVGVRPNVRPLAGLLDIYGGYGVVLVDKQGARLFHFHLGQLKEQDGVIGDTVKKIKGGGSAVQGMRGGTITPTRVVEETIERNMRESVEFAISFFEENHIRRILLGGTEDNIALFRNYLPKAWQSLVVGTFSAPMTASFNEVWSRVFEIGHKAEQEREAQIIDRLITQFSKKSDAVVGLEDTLKAVNEGRVQTLVLNHGFEREGYRCPDCNSLTISPEKTCVACEKPAEKVQDVVALAVSDVFANGGEVEMIHDQPELDKVGNIGAFLRY